ncbi:MAG TPA: hypothetical protein VF469_40455 [Kofleriaceae bacterium]
MLESATARGLSHPRMPAVCPNDVQFAVVDQHHYIPSTVTPVDDKVHVDRPGDQAMRAWMTTPPPTA